MDNIMIGERIKRKRLSAGMSLQDLADKLNGLGVHLSKAALSNYETKKTLPNAKTLWALARIFGVSMEYFVKESETAVSLGYRKKSSLSSQRHDQIVAFIQDEIEKRVEIDTILAIESNSALPVQREIDKIEDAEPIAASVRKEWALGDQPIASVSALLEDRGWYVIQSPNEEDFDGFAGIIEATQRPFAVSRSGISVDRMRLNLLHEAGHAFLKCPEEKLTEKAAFRFAAALLFPKEKVFDELGGKRSSIDMDELVLLKKKYGLSIQAMAFRLRDLEIITSSYFSLIFTYLTQLGFRVQEPGSEELTFQEEPMTFRRHVYRARAEGLISEQDVARFLPGHVTRPESSGPKTSSDIKRLLSLPKAERESILRAAASAAVEDYSTSEVNLGESVDDIKKYP
jgi:transcriptional regulator with XRE-family HTH domain